MTLENQSIPAEHRLNFLKEKYPADNCNKNSSPHLFWGGISILEEDLWRSCSGQTMVWLQKQMNKSDGHRASPTVSPKHVVVLFAGLSYHMSTGGQLLSEKVFITHDMWYFSVIQVCWLISFFWLKLDHARHWFYGLISFLRSCSMILFCDFGTWNIPKPFLTLRYAWTGLSLADLVHWPCATDWGHDGCESWLGRTTRNLAISNIESLFISC